MNETELWICPHLGCKTCMVKKERKTRRPHCTHSIPHEKNGGCSGDRCDIDTSDGQFVQLGCKCVPYKPPVELVKEMFEI